MTTQKTFLRILKNRNSSEKLAIEHKKWAEDTQDFREMRVSILRGLQA